MRNNRRTCGTGYGRPCWSWRRDPLANRQVKRLVGTDTLLRLRVGDVRVVFSIEQEELLILIIAIGNRGDIYRRL
ncbi:MAG: type II toxin-antitoxin system RelE family toxin [Sulfobacillus sp.]